MKKLSEVMRSKIMVWQSLLILLLFSSGPLVTSYIYKHGMTKLTSKIDLLAKSSDLKYGRLAYKFIFQNSERKEEFKALCRQLEDAYGKDLSNLELSDINNKSLDQLLGVDLK